MGRTNIPYGHKRLTYGVVRGRTHDVEGWGFERRWPRRSRFLHEKLRDVWLSSGVPPSIKKMPIFRFIFLGFLETKSLLFLKKPTLMGFLNRQ